MFEKVFGFVQLCNVFRQRSPLVGCMIVSFSGSWPSSFSSLDQIKSRPQFLSLLSSTCCIKMKNHLSRFCVFAILSLFPDIRRIMANIIVGIIVIICTTLRHCCSRFCKHAWAGVLVIGSYFFGFFCRETLFLCKKFYFNKGDILKGSCCLL